MLLQHDASAKDSATFLLGCARHIMTFLPASLHRTYSLSGLPGKDWAFTGLQLAQLGSRLMDTEDGPSFSTLPSSQQEIKGSLLPSFP